MRFSVLKGLPENIKTVTGFGGYEHSDNAGLSTFYDMADLSSDKYPLLSVRKKRGRWARTGSTAGNFPDGILTLTGENINSAERVNEKIVFCTDSGVYVNGVRYPGVTLEDIRPLKHRIAPFGRSFMIYPDGIFFDAGTDGYTVKHTRYRFVCPDTLLELCDAFGTAVSFDGSGDELPPSAAEGFRFLKTGEQSTYMYTFSAGHWGNETKIYIKLSASGIGRYAYEGEKLNAEGISGKNEKCVITAFSSGSITVDLQGRLDAAISAAGGQLVLTGLVLSQKMPFTDHMCEHGNRLWGCRYGDDGSGKFVNELYASALGDPTIWDKFDGISSDSFCASVGSGGDFTGICSLGGDIICFKEEELIRITGNDPSDFTVSATPARGILKSSSGSLAVLNEKAFYRSASGITVYDGAMPYVISRGFGSLAYDCICAGAYKGKYYTVVCEKDGARGIMVYDTETGLWHKESDRENTEAFVSLNGHLIMICGGEVRSGVKNYSFRSVDPVSGEAFDLFCADGETECVFIPEEPQSWYAVTGNICSGFAGTKIIRGIIFRISAEKDSVFRAEVSCNDSDVFKEICMIRRPENGIISLRVNTPRCDSFRLRLSGIGECTLHTLSVITENTSEVSRHG